MGRKLKGSRPGRKTDFTDEQVQFLEGYGKRFATGSGNGSLYTEVTEAWIKTFGYEGLNPNNKNGVDHAILRLDADLNSLPDGERDKVLDARRSAKQAIRNKIGNWFRNRYNSRKEDLGGVHEVMRSLLQISKDRPRRKTVLGMYSELAYEPKLKLAFNEVWDKCLQSGIPAKDRINYVKRFTRESFWKESEEVRDEIRARCEEKHLEAVEAWRKRMEWAGTPESYQTALSNLDSVLPPFADAISTYTGMIAIVTLVGPSGVDGGEIAVRSTQSVNAKDKFKQTWAEVDLPGYRALQDSLINYGRNYFDEAECLARVINVRDDSEIATPDAPANELPGDDESYPEFPSVDPPGTDESHPEPPSVELPPTVQHEDPTILSSGNPAATDVTSDPVSLGIWDDWNAFMETQAASSGDVGSTGAPLASEPSQLTVETSISDEFLDFNWIPGALSVGGVEPTDSSHSITTGQDPDLVFHTNTVNPTLTLLTSTPHVQHSNPLQLVSNVESIVSPKQSAHTLHRANLPGMCNKENHDASNAHDAHSVQQSVKPSVQGNTGEPLAGAEHVGGKEMTLAGRKSVPVDGDNQEQLTTGRKRKPKRKAPADPDDGNSSPADGKRSRRKVVLPARLREGGYIAPKKGARAS